MMADQIDETVKRTERYFYNDGLVELAIGLLFFVTGIVLYAWQGAGSSPALTVLLLLALVLLGVGGTLLLRQGIQGAKKRVTYPRTGYVSYRKDRFSNSRYIFMALALIMAIASVFLPDELNQMQLMIGPIFAVILVYFGYHYGLPRFYLPAAFALITGVGTTFLLKDELLGTSLTFGLSGAVLLLTGFFAFRAYLQRYPKPEEE